MQSSEFLHIFDSGRYIFDMSQLSDAKLRTEDGCTFNIHRILLAFCSDYFGDMFCGTDRDMGEFTIPGISGECLSNILCYVYTGDIRITERNIRDLMIAADYLLLKDLHMKIKQSIKANMTELNCLRILTAAHQISDEDIFQECFRFIQMRFEGLVRRQKDELADLPLEVFRSILSDRSLYVYDESTVWQAIVDWTQKDIPSRMCSVPQLLLTLAVEDIKEELATKILLHEIISKNSLMDDLRSLKDFTSNLDVLLTFLRSYSSPFTQPFSHRIPSKLYVVSTSEGEHEAVNNHNLYITYDENTDWWRKISEVRHRPEFVIAIGHSIYVFNVLGFKNFDLSVMNWITMETFGYFYLDYCVVAIDAYIYMLGQHTSETEPYSLQVYDTVNNRWFNGVSLPNICYGAFVVVEKKIYLVGNGRSFEGMMTQMFDPVTQQWSLLSPPTVRRSWFALVVYREKIYLVGGKTETEDFYFSNAEVFDPATNLWQELPNMPYTYVSIKAVVVNDQLIVYEQLDGYNERVKSVRWNAGMECWEKLDNTHSLSDLRRHGFFSVDNVDAIRVITKQSRDPRAQMEKSLFV